jgi:hypothetical protein
MSEIIDEYFGYGNHQGRSAIIYKDAVGYFVEFLENGLSIEQRELADHSLRYAEDTAENWITGIIP